MANKDMPKDHYVAIRLTPDHIADLLYIIGDSHPTTITGYVTGIVYDHIGDEKKRRREHDSRWSDMDTQKDIIELIKSINPTYGSPKTRGQIVRASLKRKKKGGR